MGLSLGVFFALIALVAYGFLRVPQKRLIDRVGVYSAIFYVMLVEVVVLGVFYLFSSVPFPDFTLQSIGTVLFLGVTGVLGILSFYKANKLGHVSVVTAVASMFAVVTVLLSFVFFSEHLTTTQIVGIIVTLAGSFIVSVEWSELKGKGSHHFVPGIPHALLAALLFGFYYAAYKIAVVQIGVMSATFFSEGVILLALLIPAIELRPRLHKGTFKYALWAGIALAIAVLSYAAGISMALVSLVAPIVAASPLVTAVFAHFWLKEKLDVHQHIGIVVAVLGIVLVSL